LIIPVILPGTNKRYELKYDNLSYILVQIKNRKTPRYGNEKKLIFTNMTPKGQKAGGGQCRLHGTGNSRICLMMDLGTQTRPRTPVNIEKTQDKRTSLNISVTGLSCSGYACLTEQICSALALINEPEEDDIKPTTLPDEQLDSLMVRYGLVDDP